MLNGTFLSFPEVLIYGSGLEALTTLQSLLTGGVDPSLITFVRPRPHSCFNSRTVEERVQRSLEESGVQLLTGHTLSSVEEGGVSLLDGDHTLFAHCQVKSELLPVRWCDFGVENRPEFLSSFIIIHTLCHLRASSVWRRKKSLEQYSQVNTSLPLSLGSFNDLSLSLSL